MIQSAHISTVWSDPDNSMTIFLCGPISCPVDSAGKALRAAAQHVLANVNPFFAPDVLLATVWLLFDVVTTHLDRW